MIRSVFNKVRERFESQNKEESPRDFRYEPLTAEPLEQRIMLAWVGFFDGITLDLVQTFDDGDTTIDNSGVGGAFRTIDNADTLTFVDAQNVTVTMLDGTANQLNFDINSSHTGDVTLNLGDGPRDVVFSGFGIPGIANTAGGDFTVNAGTGPQFINLAPQVGVPIPFQTGGSATFDLGEGFDTVYNNENFVIIGQDLNLRGVNLFRYTDFLFPVPLDADLKVGGNFTMDTSNESIESFLVEGGTFHDPDPDVNERSIIFGDFIFIGGDDIDHVDLNDTYIVGDVDIDLGEGTPFFGDPQNVTTTLTFPLLLGGPTAQIDGNIRIAAGDANLGNFITLDGEFFGDTVTFEMSDKVDEIEYSLLGTQADIDATMGAGADKFTLNVGVNVLDIDFGNDLLDEFVNNYGQFTFDSDITNFQWFDHLYTVGDDRMVMNQLMDVGDIIIDNDGGPLLNGIDWRVFTGLGGVGSTTPAANFELNMLDHTGNVEMDLVNPVIAFLTLNVGDGDRLIEFTGASNNPLRDINITADQGDQHVELSVNAPLAVATLNVDLGVGFDSVDDDANNLLIAEDFIFRGVNHFENDGILAVTRHASVGTTIETEDTVFANNQTMTVGGFFTYNGGDGRDEVRLNGAGSTIFNMTAEIHVGDNTTGGTQSVQMDGGNTFVNQFLNVSATGSTFTDEFLSGLGTTFGSNVRINLGDGPNTAVVMGDFNGFWVDYFGGSGDDITTFGTTGVPADVMFDLGPGNDSFTLLAGASISSLFSDSFLIDFGSGDDTFNNLYGPFDFSAVLLDLDGFDHIYSLPFDRLTSTQVSDPGPVTVDNNGTLGSFRFLDGGTNELTTASELIIHMQDHSGTDLGLNLDSAFGGDVTINLNDGNRDLNFGGTDNSITGDLSISGGAGMQNVNVADNADLGVGGNLSIDLGTENDTVDENGNNINVTGSMDFDGVNQFSNQGAVTVGGNVNVDTTGETEISEFDDDGSMNIGGDFTFTGGGGRDSVLLNGLAGTVINGNADINVGSNTIGGTQNIFLNVGTTSVGGTLDVVSTDSTNTDTFLGDPGAAFGDDITIDLAGGQNTATIRGIFGGDDVKYFGGDQGDNVTFGTVGNPADVNVVLGGGADTFTLDAGSVISPTTLRVDFGGGNDTFVNNFGAFTFNANLLNWQGYNRFYNHGLSRLIITQVADTGDITVDNNGAGNAIRVINGFITEMTPADNVRVNLMSNTNTDVDVDWDAAQAGYTILDMKAGDRNVRFTGTSNTIGDFLRVEAGTNGEQNVTLASIADLNVAQSVVINLRNGVDSVQHGPNNVNVGTNFILRAVDNYTNDNTINVSGNFTVNNTFFNEASMIVNAGTLFAGGTMNFFGGTKADSVFMNGVNVAGNVNIELGSGNAPQTVDFSSANVNRLRITGGSTVGGNTVVTNASTVVTDEVIVNFSGTTTINNVTLRGTYNGTYGTYRGGVGRDNVIFGATASNMNFVTRLGNGNDEYTLESTTDVFMALLDFGGGSDTFNDEIGEPYPFPLSIINL